MRRVNFLVALCVLPFGSLSYAQDSHDDIVVEGSREAIAQRVETLAKSITRRTRIDKPIPRQHGAICLAVSGMSPEFAIALIGRVEDNARQLGIFVQGKGCQVNTLVAFTRNSRKEVERLRKEEPELFSTMLDYEYDRILRGNGAVQSWQATQLKGADGKEFASAVIDGREVELNDQPFASHLAQQLRVDIEGAVVVFDNAFVPGKSIQQLADYATMRLFAPTDDVSNEGEPAVSTILSLFSNGVDAPPGLTEFDRAYLTALYRLAPTARGAAVSDAVRAAYERGTGRLEAVPSSE